MLFLEIVVSAPRRKEIKIGLKERDLSGLFLIGCATDCAMNQWTEQEVLLKESFKKVEELSGEVRVLEQSISRLGAEVAHLEKNINALSFRPRLTAYKLPRGVVLCGAGV